jgi:hypothetical protein
MEYYVFSTEAEALAAESDIAAIGNAPVVGINAKTGQPEPAKQKTTRWAVPWQRATDQKWVFPRLPNEIRNSIDAQIASSFQASHAYTIEELDPEWYPQSPE